MIRNAAPAFPARRPDHWRALRDPVVLRFLDFQLTPFARHGHTWPGLHDRSARPNAGARSGGGWRLSRRSGGIDVLRGPAFPRIYRLRRSRSRIYRRPAERGPASKADQSVLHAPTTAGVRTSKGASRRRSYWTTPPHRGVHQALGALAPVRPAGRPSGAVSAHRRSPPKESTF